MNSYKHMRRLGLSVAILLAGCHSESKTRGAVLVNTTQETDRGVVTSETVEALPVEDRDFAMPPNKKNCKTIDDTCVFDTGWKPASPNLYLTSLTDDEANTDGAGCTGIDDRGQTVLSLVPEGPITFRYKGRLHSIPQSAPAIDHNYFSEYYGDGITFRFDTSHGIIAQGLESRTFRAEAQMTVEGRVLPIEIRLECGA